VEAEVDKVALTEVMVVLEVIVNLLAPLDPEELPPELAMDVVVEAVAALGLEVPEDQQPRDVSLVLSVVEVAAPVSRAPPLAQMVVPVVPFLLLFKLTVIFI
jgi:hypothetical protein